MRCTGKTKSGTRCKRNAPEGSAFCASHVDQATAGTPGPEDRSEDPIMGADEAAGGGPRSEHRTHAATGDSPSPDEGLADEWWDSAVEVAKVAAVVIVALALGRAIRSL